MNPFWTAILACILLGERILVVEIIGITICFVGVVLISLSKNSELQNDQPVEQPDGQTTETDEQNEPGPVDEDSSEITKYLGVMVAIGSAIFFALTSVLNRKLKAISYSSLMVYHGIIGGGLAAIVIAIEGAIRGGFRIYTPVQYLFLLCSACLDAIACNSMTIAT